MGEAILGSEAVAAGVISRGRLRWNHRIIYPDVYVPRDAEITMAVKAHAAYLWARRRAVVTGRAAAALHGAKWVDDVEPVELLCSNNHRPFGIVTRRERYSPDEVMIVDGIRVATPARTAFDLGRHLHRGKAVAHLDALASATGIGPAEVLSLANRYAGARGTRALRTAADLMDAGAQSPKETWLRLLLIDAGYPRPTTQIPVFDDYSEPFAYLDMGWQDVMIAVEYDGDQHRKDRGRYVWDERRLRRLLRLGWLHVKVIAEDRPADVLARVRYAWTLRERESMAVKAPA
ncbi:hypothetical protein O6P37_02420 [Mycobacterium sp. CPCC 205372]|uniref:Cullin, a subunit of E3 ubiquitin ligase n=1 Tax=Mycobacterium hippophais TaxID=3016340 RepID=A0ABT4PMB4_9MYCO|nr:hypothetical protein [Mycobacterium hippophais]MCZ8377707.1 hypothetical protein [Mycobacterium hippophais]